jgi:hypothetical protein
VDTGSTPFPISNLKPPKFFLRPYQGVSCDTAWYRSRRNYAYGFESVWNRGEIYFPGNIARGVDVAGMHKMLVTLRPSVRLIRAHAQAGTGMMR